VLEYNTKPNICLINKNIKQIFKFEQTPMIDFFKKYNPHLTTEQQTQILESFKQESFKKNEVLFKSGAQNTKHYLIEKGLLRLYIIDSKGKEFNVLFAKENQIIGDLSTPNATNFYLEAIENTTAFSITEDKLQLISKSLDSIFGSSSNSYLRKSYIFLQNRLISILTKTAEENYIEFRDNYPELIQRLPQYQIASYLGVSAEFLSKAIAKSWKKH